MNRRTWLKSCALGSIPLLAGCIGRGSSQHPAATVSRTVTTYPSQPTSTYDVRADVAHPSETDPLEFRDLSEGSRLEIANAIVRGEYWTWRSPTVLQEDLHQEFIEFQGEFFDIGVGVADSFTPPTHGPGTGSGWIPPLAVEATVAGDKLTVEATNELDVPLDLHHVDRPYFGVLTAVGDDVMTLQHDEYETNEHIHTTGIVRSDHVYRHEMQTKTLDPDESISDIYVFPEAISDESIIWFTIPLGEDTLDLFLKGGTTARVRIRLKE